MSGTTLQEDPFGEADGTPIDEDNYKPPEVDATKAKDVPPSRPDLAPPSLSRPDVKDLSTWEYLQEVWDFEKNECKVPWEGSPSHHRQYSQHWTTCTTSATTMDNSCELN